MAREPTRTSPISFVGGLNLVSPVFQMEPGEAKVLHNYAVNSLGRYERVKGFLRFDGHRDPLSYPFTVLKMTEDQLKHGFPHNIGDLVYGSKSGAGGRVQVVNADEVVLVDVTDTFARGETVSECYGTVQAVSVGASTGHVSRTQLYRREVAEYHARNIKPVPGSGPIRGLAVFHTEVLAWRDNADGNETVLWRSSPAGWLKVKVVPPRDYFPPYPYQYLIYSGQAGQLRYDIDSTDPDTHRELEAFRRGYFSRAGTFGNLLLPSNDAEKDAVRAIYYYHPTHDSTRIVFDPGIRRGDFGELEIYVEDTPMYRFREAIQNPNWKPGDTAHPKTIPQAGVTIRHPADSTQIEIDIDERIELWTARQRVGFFLFTKDQLPDDPNHRRQWAIKAPSHCAEDQKLTIQLKATHDGHDVQGATVTWDLVGLGDPPHHLKTGAIQGTSVTAADGTITLEWEFTPDGHEDHETLEWKGVTDYGVQLHAEIILDDVQLPEQSHFYVITGPHTMRAGTADKFIVTVTNTENELVSHQRVDWELDRLPGSHSKLPMTGNFITDGNGQGQIEVALTESAPLETFLVTLTHPVRKQFAVEVTPIPVPKPPPPEVPDKAPGDFTAVAVSSTSIVLSWLDDSVDPAATGFRLERERVGAPGQWALLGEFPSITLTYRDLRCADKTHYRYRLVAYNVNGSTSYVYAEATTKAAVPDFAPSEFVAQAYATDGIAMRWKDNCTNEDFYELQRSTDNHHFTVLRADLPAGTTFYDDSGLSAGTQYYYRVRAVNADGTTPWDTTHATTDHVVISARPPAVPVNVTLSPLTYDQMTLRWTPNPDTSLGGAPDTYYIERRLHESPDWASVEELDDQKRSYVLTGLQDATEYEVRICAKNKYGQSLFVDVVNSTPALPGEPAPAAPDDVSLSDATFNSLTLHWKENKNGGLPVTYLIEMQKVGDTGWTSVIRVDHIKEEEMTFKVVGLDESTQYRMRVKAENEAGTSAPSTAFGATTAAPVVPPPLPAQPGELKNFRVVNATSSQIRISWAVGTGGPVEYFELAAAPVGTSWQPSRKLSNDILIFTFTQLASGRDYQFKVRAGNAAGQSAWSFVSGRTAPSTRPPATRPPSGGGDSGADYTYRASGNVRFAESPEHMDALAPAGSEDQIFGWSAYTKTGGVRYGLPRLPITGSGLNIEALTAVYDTKGGGVNVVISRPSGVHASAREKFESGYLDVVVKTASGYTLSMKRAASESIFLDNRSTRHCFIRFSEPGAKKIIDSFRQFPSATITVRLH